MNDVMLSAWSLACLALATTVPMQPSRSAALRPVVVGGDCTGCEAHQANGDGFNDGWQITQQGHVHMLASLGVKPGDCSWFDEQCVPTDNCSFTAYCITTGTTPFHDNLAPCNWSVTTPVFGEVLITHQEFPWGCDKTYWSWFLAFFDGATNCGNGSLQGEVEFSGYCDRCSGV